MASSKAVRAPTTASLPNNLRIPSTTPSLIKNLDRLSRQALIDLALAWLDGEHGDIPFPPYLQRDSEGDGEETVPYPAAETVEEVREEYEDLQQRKGGKREVLERILEGDWRHGITLRQLAMADIRYIDDHPTSLRWTALELRRINAPNTIHTPDDWSASFPRIQAATFVKALQKEVAPLVKAHYHIARSSTVPITFIRIFVVDSPYNSPRQAPEIFADSSRVIYVAFPDSSPYVYTSISASIGKAGASSKSSVTTDPRSLQRIVRDAIPKALSRPHNRYNLNATGLTAKHLSTLLALRGPGRSTAANGAFSIFADAALEGSPLDPRPSNTVSAEEHVRKSLRHAGESPENATNLEERLDHKDSKSKRQPSGQDIGSLSPTSKRRRLACSSRFGSSMTPAPLDRLDIRFLDKVAVNEEEDDEDGSFDLSVPVLSLSFAGSDVIGGIRKLAELGIVDAERMPSWMTGEEGVSTAAVRGGQRVMKLE